MSQKKGSKRYHKLLDGVDNLRAALLPAKFDPTGSYRSPARVHLRAVSFRILVHAELESFLEDRAHELFAAAWEAWHGKKVPSRTITALLAFSGVATMPPPSKLERTSTNQKSYVSVDIPIQKAQAEWRATHKDNHGIKESNVLGLLLPLGIAHDSLDATLLADLNSFGADRGLVAHRSSVQVVQVADPQIEHQRARQLTDNLLGLDSLIEDEIAEVQALVQALRG